MSKHKTYKLRHPERVKANLARHYWKYKVGGKCEVCRYWVAPNSRYCEKHSINKLVGRNGFNRLQHEIKNDLGISVGKLDRELVVLYWLWLNIKGEIMNHGRRNH